MIDFERAFITAVHQLKLSTLFSCCFFHFVSNIKKHARPVIEELKKTTGRDAMETKMGVQAKRALMMLPLLPLGLITVDAVDMIILRWKRAFGHRPDFDELRDYIVRTYVGPNATFKKEV